MDNIVPAEEPELQPAPGQGFERRAFEFKLEELSDDGEFSGYASVFGNVDSYGDVVEHGAFKRTIKARKGRVKVLWQHDSSQPIGVSAELAEDEVGLATRGRLVLTVQRAREAHELLKAGALDGLSIGFQTIKSEVLRDGDGNYLGRKLKELKLWEYSLVTFPANERALVGDVKDLDPERLSAALARLRDSDPEFVKALLGGLDPAFATRGTDGLAAAAEDPTAVAVTPALRALKHLRANYTAKEALSL